VEVVVGQYNHKIQKENRPHLMRLVRNIMFAPTEDKYNIEVETFKSDSVANKYMKYTSHIEKLLARSKEWCLCFRVNLSTRGNNTNNIVEASIRIFKDCILLRYKAFNVISLVHFTCVNLENYHVKRLLAFPSNRKSQPSLIYNSLVRKAQNLNAVQISEHININMYVKKKDGRQ
jgi:hypothetical protein